MTDSPFRRKALAFHRCGAYISFLPEERPYFQGIQGGMGAKEDPGWIVGQAQEVYERSLSYGTATSGTPARDQGIPAKTH